jgi:hypothetical protein
MDYVKNIVLRYMLDDEHQSQLVGVIATLLNFSPEETQKILNKTSKTKVSPMFGANAHNSSHLPV